MDVDMVVIPNSCFTVLFVKQFYGHGDDSIDININDMEFNETLNGTWMPLDFTIRDAQDKTHKIRQTAFVAPR